MLLWSIRYSRLFRMPGRETTPFMTSTRCFLDYWEELHTMKFPIADSMSTFAFEFQKQRDHQNLFHFSMRLRPKFVALHSNILHCHPLPNLESVDEFTSEETPHRMLSSSPAPAQSTDSPTALTALYRPSVSHGLLNQGPSSLGPVNRGQ